MNLNYSSKTQKFINLTQRCKKNKKIHQKFERERDRDNLFCEEIKLCKKWKREWKIYSKRVWIRKNKIKEDEEKNE